MNKKNQMFIFGLLVFSSDLIYGATRTPYIITFFLRPYSQHSASEKQPKTLEKAKRKTINQMLNNMHPKFSSNLVHKNTPINVAGVYAIFNGEATFSDINGEIAFQRKTVQPKFSLLIAEKIEPLLLNPLQKNTIQGFVLSADLNYKHYIINQIQTPEGKYKWEVKEEPISIKQKIPYNTIVLFTDPRNVIVDNNSEAFKMDGNLLLPDIYLKNNNQLNALEFLSIRQYFSKQKKRYEFKPGLYQERIL